MNTLMSLVNIRPTARPGYRNQKRTFAFFRPHPWCAVLEEQTFYCLVLVLE